MPTVDEVLSLHERRDIMETEAIAILKKLNEAGVGVKGDLVDSQGSPRVEIDTHDISSLRSRLSDLEKEIEDVNAQMRSGLATVIARNEDADTNAHNSVNADITERGDKGALETSGGNPFAYILEVAAGSPADEAGLRAGDEIALFGSIDVTNNYALTALDDEISRDSVQLQVLRDKQPLSLTLHPHSNWGGPGRLGCRLLPILPLPTM